MRLEKVKPHRVYEDIVAQISKLMAEGNLSPGDRLMGEREMAAALGVSRTTLREALRTLELYGLVDIKHGDGTFMRNHHHNQIITPLALALSVEPNSIEELWEIRIYLEVDCTGLAAERITNEYLKYLAEVLEELKAEVNDSSLYRKADLRFHNIIAQASQNSVMARLMQTFASHIDQMMQRAYQGSSFHDGNSHQQSLNGHLRIYESIKEKNVQNSRERMREHLIDGLMAHRVLQNINKHQSSSST